MADPIMLHELEEHCRAVGRLIKDALPDEGVVFMLHLSTTGHGGWSTYVSNAERGDMISVLHELLEKLEV